MTYPQKAMGLLQPVVDHASMSSLGFGSVPSDPYPGSDYEHDELSLRDCSCGGHEASPEPKPLNAAPESLLVSRFDSMPSLAPILLSESSIPSLSTFASPEARKLEDDDSLDCWYDDLDALGRSSKSPDEFDFKESKDQCIQAVYPSPKKNHEMRWKDQASLHDSTPFSPRRKSFNDVLLSDTIGSPTDVFSFSHHGAPPISSLGDTPPKAPRRGRSNDFPKRPKRRASADTFLTPPLHHLDQRFAHLRFGNDAQNKSWVRN
jgi:hypothetical protein